LLVEVMVLTGLVIQLAGKPPVVSALLEPA
jgi:hypothetical protein